MNNFWLILIGSITSGTIGIVITKAYERGKTKAETQNINITGELSIGEAWQKYAIQQQKDLEEFRKRLDVLETDNNELRRRIKSLEIECDSLRSENSKLKAELMTYQKK